MNEASNGVAGAKKTSVTGSVASLRKELHTILSCDISGLDLMTGQVPSNS